MAYVPGQEFDIFLSYASVDDGRRDPTDEKSRWVSSLFLPALKIAIEAKLGRQNLLQVFFDRRELDSASQLTPSIERAIDGSAILVAINSPGYLHPDASWCRIERQRFLSRLGGSDATRAAQRRLWIVHKDAIPRQTWQKEFYPDVRGMDFYITDEEDRVRLLPRQENKQDFIDKIENLAGEITTRLQELKHAAEDQGPSGSATRERRSIEGDSPERPRIYLAETPGELDSIRSWMSDHLEDAGFTVLPQGEDGDGDYLAWVRRQLQGSIAFVQLLGQYPWKRGNYDVLQYQEAKAAGLPVIRHRAPEIDLEKLPEAHRKFIDAPDVKRMGLGDFKDHVLRVVEGLRVFNRQQQSPGSHSGFVRILVRDSDRALLGQAAAGWVDAAGIRVDVLKEKESLVDANLRDPCHGILVLYGTDSPDDVRDRMQPCREVLLCHKEADRRPEVAVVFCPPPEPVMEKPLFFTLPELRRLRFDHPAGVEDFLRRVRGLAP